MIMFAIVTFTVTTLGGVVTWTLASNYMYSQRERSAERQASVNARYVAAELRAGSAGLTDLLTGLAGSSGTTALVIDADKAVVDQDLTTSTTDQLVADVRQRVSLTERVTFQRGSLLVVGEPMPDEEAVYVEVFSLAELGRIQGFLGWTLLATVVASTAGGAALGRWASRRALRPLSDLTEAANAVAHGDLHTRLPAVRDPDLAPLAAAFNETTAKLQRRVEIDARFASDVSHELRSPLTTMVNAVAVLRRRRAEMPPGAVEALDLLDSELHRFARLVTDLLEISRLDQGGDLVLEPVDVVELVRQSSPQHVGFLDPSDAGPGGTGPMIVRGDRRLLERVVVNLVDNAERHGGGLVRLGVVRDADVVRLEVDDNGPGVPPGDRDRVFERFARMMTAPRGADSSGAGLGLALVAQHVRAHGGRVHVEDRRGGGARFVVEIPSYEP